MLRSVEYILHIPSLLPSFYLHILIVRAIDSNKRIYTIAAKGCGIIDFQKGMDVIAKYNVILIDDLLNSLESLTYN